jgi:hypothetical protein
MSDKRARYAIAISVTIAAVTAACGSTAASSSAGPPTYAQEIALVGCMRSHGVPNFPDPSASGGYSLTATGSLVGADGSVDINSSQAQTAYDACRHLLPGGPSISQLEQDVQQAQQRQARLLPLLLKYSECMRSHGVPNFPSPGQSAPAGTPIDVNSPTFLAATSACRSLLPAGAHVTIHQSSSSSPSPS